MKKFTAIVICALLASWIYLAASILLFVAAQDEDISERVVKSQYQLMPSPKYWITHARKAY